VAFDTRKVADGAHEIRVRGRGCVGQPDNRARPQRFVVDTRPPRMTRRVAMASTTTSTARSTARTRAAPAVKTVTRGRCRRPRPDRRSRPSPVSRHRSSPGRRPCSHLTASTAPPSRGIPNGDRPADDARLTANFSASGSRILTTRYGGSVVVRGKLVDGRGAPIGNARVEMLSRNANPGSSFVDKGGARTRPDGTWTVVMPRDVSSRTLSFRYRSHLGDAQPVAEVALTLRVRAAVALKVTPKVASSRGGLRISGRLLGAPLPARGKVVELQARGKGGGRWITFRTVRSDARGRFSTRYRFRNTVGPVTYVFRARAREEAAYPFLTGTSASSASECAEQVGAPAGHLVRRRARRPAWAPPSRRPTPLSALRRVTARGAKARGPGRRPGESANSGGARGIERGRRGARREPRSASRECRLRGAACSSGSPSSPPQKLRREGDEAAGHRCWSRGKRAGRPGRRACRRAGPRIAVA
jgi:hypothetical protein